MPKEWKDRYVNKNRLKTIKECVNKIAMDWAELAAQLIPFGANWEERFREIGIEKVRERECGFMAISLATPNEQF